MPDAIRSTRRVPRLGALAALIGGLSVLVAIPGAQASNSVSTEQARAHVLEAEIEAEGARASELVNTYNVVQLSLEQNQRSIAADDRSLDRDLAAQQATAAKLRATAINAYIDATTGGGSSFAVFGSSSQMNKVSEEQTYLGVASRQLDVESNALQTAQHRTSTAQATLRAHESIERHQLAQLSSAKTQAQSAISADESVLRGVNAHLVALVNAATEQREAEVEAAAEAALARQAAQAAAQAAAAPPAATTITATPGGYANPLRGIADLQSERIDQGVDYSGYGPIYALGDGVIESTVCGGWPGGTFISYRLSSGPANGLLVYAAEDIEPTVFIGEHVNSHTVLGQVYEGDTGIETGWASSPDGVTMAAEYGQYFGGNSTAFGANFSQLLTSLGGAGGVLQNSPPTGSIPGGWPTF